MKKIKLLNLVKETLKIGNHIYKPIKSSNGDTIFVGKDGILGNHSTHISWEEIETLKSKV